MFPPANEDAPSSPSSQPRLPLLNLRKGKGGLSIDPMAPEQPTLRTSKFVNIPPITPTTQKAINELHYRDVSPSKSKRAGARLNNMNKSFDTARLSWRSFHEVELPPSLLFDSWWFEGGQRYTMHLVYNTAAKTCSAGMSVAAGAGYLGGGLETLAQATMEPWDFHVGAEVFLLGKQVTLRKAGDVATLTWLDGQAQALLRERTRLQKELEKYRPVVAKTSQFSKPQRNECMQIDTHEHVPLGGRVNLRTLRQHVRQLLSALRQHQLSLPLIKSVAAEGLLVSMNGPLNWEILQPAPDSMTDGKSSTPGSEIMMSPFSTHGRRTRGRGTGGSVSRRMGEVSLELITRVPLAASAAGLARPKLLVKAVPSLPAPATPSTPALPPPPPMPEPEAKPVPALEPVAVEASDPELFGFSDFAKRAFREGHTGSQKAFLNEPLSNAASGAINHLEGLGEFSDQQRPLREAEQQQQQQIGLEGSREAAAAGASNPSEQSRGAAGLSAEHSTEAGAAAAMQQAGQESLAAAAFSAAEASGGPRLLPAEKSGEPRTPAAEVAAGLGSAGGPEEDSAVGPEDQASEADLAVEASDMAASSGGEGAALDEEEDSYEMDPDQEEEEAEAGREEEKEEEEAEAGMEEEKEEEEVEAGREEEKDEEEVEAGREDEMDEEEEAPSTAEEDDTEKMVLEAEEDSEQVALAAEESEVAAPSQAASGAPSLEASNAEMEGDAATTGPATDTVEMNSEAATAGMVADSAEIEGMVMAPGPAEDALHGEASGGDPDAVMAGEADSGMGDAHSSGAAQEAVGSERSSKALDGGEKAGTAGAAGGEDEAESGELEGEVEGGQMEGEASAGAEGMERGAPADVEGMEAEASVGAEGMEGEVSPVDVEGMEGKADPEAMEGKASADAEGAVDTSDSEMIEGVAPLELAEMAGKASDDADELMDKALVDEPGAVDKEADSAETAEAPGSEASQALAPLAVEAGSAGLDSGASLAALSDGNEVATSSAMLGEEEEGQEDYEGPVSGDINEQSAQGSGEIDGVAAEASEGDAPGMGEEEEEEEEEEGAEGEEGEEAEGEEEVQGEEGEQ